MFVRDSLHRLFVYGPDRLKRLMRCNCPAARRRSEARKQRELLGKERRFCCTTICNHLPGVEATAAFVDTNRDGVEDVLSIIFSTEFADYEILTAELSRGAS